MTRYCYVRGGRLTEISEELLRKFEPSRTEERKIENGDWTAETIVEEIQEVPGLAYDEVIETEIIGRVSYFNGGIIPYEGSEEEAADIARETPAPVDPSARKAEIVERLGALKSQIEGLTMLGESTGEQNAEIEALRNEYASLN